VLKKRSAKQVRPIPEQRNPDAATQPAALRPGVLPSLWPLVSCMWLFIALAFMVEECLEHPSDIFQSVQFVSVRWLPWVFLTPVIYWLSSRYPLERTTWPRAIGIYILLSVVVATGLSALSYVAGAYPPGGRGPFGPPERGHGRGAGFERPPEPPDHSPFSIEPLSERPPRRPWPSGRQRTRGPGQQLARLASFQLPIFWLMVLVLHGLRFYREAKERERHEADLEARLTQARLQALRMQLNPHFLFNTLNSIASLVYDQPKVADDMIASLSDLLRLTLNSSDRQEVTLREELQFLEQYLRIAQARFGERLKFNQRIEPTALDAIVPILILQPLMENAVKYGIEAQLGPSNVSVSASRSGDALLLRITDSGRGPSPAEPGALKEGVGLSNTRARLEALYGAKGSMEIRRPAEGGCLVEVKLPWRTAPAAGSAPAAE
jgi:two-component sensor histidine kinase